MRARTSHSIVRTVLPSGLELFVDHVVPILRARGLCRREYADRTLREHYALVRPRSQYADAVREPVAL